MSESYAQFIARMFSLVKNHMGWDVDKTALWFRTKNPLLGNLDPDDFMQRRPQKFEKWVNAMISENTAPAANPSLKDTTAQQAKEE